MRVPGGLRPREALSAGGTGKRFLAKVVLHVSGEVVTARVGVAAFLAAVLICRGGRGLSDALSQAV